MLAEEKGRKRRWLLDEWVSKPQGHSFYGERCRRRDAVVQAAPQVWGRVELGCRHGERVHEQTPDMRPGCGVPYEKT